MPTEYQSEKSPIFDSHKSLETQRKLHIMSQLYASKVYQMFCNTRYNLTNIYLKHSAATLGAIWLGTRMALMTVLKPARRLEPRLGREADRCLDSRPPLLRSCASA